MGGHRAPLGENRHLPISISGKLQCFQHARARARAADARNYAQ